MDRPNNRSYYVGRLAASRALAQQAAHPGIAAIHKEMAARYEALLAEQELVAAWRNDEPRDDDPETAVVAIARTCA